LSAAIIEDHRIMAIPELAALRQARHFFKPRLFVPREAEGEWVGEDVAKKVRKEIAWGLALSFRLTTED
jgi:hypothetical protein